MSNGGGPDFTGIPDMVTQLPGPVATGTVQSGKIASWLAENIPEQFQIPLRGEAPIPFADLNPPIRFDTGSEGITPPFLNAPFPRPGFDPAAAEAEAISKRGDRSLGAIPGTLGLIPQDPLESIGMGAGLVKGAAMGVRSGAEGLLRTLGRYRLGNPSNIDEVAATLQRVAPPGMRPLEATAEGLSDIVRTRLGIGTVQATRDRVMGTIAQELNQITAAQQQAAMQGLTGPQALQAASRVPDLASRFRTLTDELADATSGAYNRATGTLRGGVNTLPTLRNREEIYQDIQAMLSPDQWQRFLASQTEYAQASTLGRLFSAGKRGVSNVSDVLLDPQRLQQKAKTVQDALNDISPEILRTIFRGGRPVTTDMPASLPIGFGAPGKRLSVRLPGTVMAGPLGPFGELLSPVIGGTAGALGAKAAYDFGVPLGASVGRFLNQYNPFAEAAPPQPRR